MCVHKSVQYMTRTMEMVTISMPVLYKTAGGQLRNKTEVHAAILAI